MPPTPVYGAAAFPGRSVTFVTVGVGPVALVTRYSAPPSWSSAITSRTSASDAADPCAGQYASGPGLVITPCPIGVSCVIAGPGPSVTRLTSPSTQAGTQPAADEVSTNASSAPGTPDSPSTNG